MKVFSLLLVTAAVFVLCSCGTTPPREVHAGAGTLRLTMPEPTSKGSTPQRFGLGGSISRGTSHVDTGRPQGSTNVSADFEYRAIDVLAFGLQPVYTFTDGSLDAKNHLGIATYARWRFLETDKWTFSLVPAYAFGENKAVEHGSNCSSLLVCTDTSDTSEGKVETNQGSLSVMPTYYVTDTDLFALIPTVYLSRTRASYSVVNVTKFSDARTSVSGSLVLSYAKILPIRSNDAVLHFAAGATTLRGLGPFEPKTKVEPLVHLGFQFNLGSRFSK